MEFGSSAEEITGCKGFSDYWRSARVDMATRMGGKAEIATKYCNIVISEEYASLTPSSTCLVTPRPRHWPRASILSS